MIRITLIVISAAIFVIGCATAGRKIKTEELASIVKGKTTEAELVKMLGEPNSESSTNGRKYLAWNHGNFNGAYLGMIPGVKPRYHTESLSVTIAPDGTVESYSTSKSRSLR